MAAAVVIKFTMVILFSLYRVFYFSLPHHPTPIPLMDIHVMYHAVVSRLTSRDILGGYFFLSRLSSYILSFYGYSRGVSRGGDAMSAILHHVTYATTTP